MAIIGRPGESQTPFRGYMLLLTSWPLKIYITYNNGLVSRASHLIDLKKEKWVTEVGSQKVSALQLLSLGKAKGFTEVTTLYCDFLNAVVQGKSSWRLKRMLKKADEALAVMAGRFEI